jgi:DNA-binding MarR family transcriptional regulator
VIEADADMQAQIARAVIWRLPCRGKAWPADVLALALLLDAHGPHTIAQLRDSLELSQSVTSELVERATAHGVVEKLEPVDRRLTIVQATALARQRLRTSRLYRRLQGDS